jgi:hypothetical protein
MMNICQTFLGDRLHELLLPDGHTLAYRVGKTGNVFFDELPLDWLKDHDYAACCLPVQDRKKKYGKLIGKTRTLGDAPVITLTRRRFEREVMFRCLLWAPAASLWSSGTYTGLAEQFDQVVANYRVIADEDNSAIRIEPQDSVRPWDSNVELEKKLRRPALAIVRIQFTGGLQRTVTVPILTAVQITPSLAAGE